MATVILTIKWNGKEYKIDSLTETNTVGDLKKKIEGDTGVLSDRQKLLGLKYKGKIPDNDVVLSDLKLKPGSKIMMMGTREEEITKVVEPPSDIPEVVNDFDIEEDEIAVENREEFLAKIERRVKDYKIEVINEPRTDKKLLVLDIDYTLFAVQIKLLVSEFRSRKIPVLVDHRSVAETANELMRPFLHEFLTSAYEDYDIVIWSATGMKWIEVKMKELGVSSHSAYKLCFMMDSSAMISVHTPKYGVIEVKPLGVIWGKYPHWGPHNTIMFDDIRRNFIMNPQTGLKIRPFKQAHFNREKDKELPKLAKYLKAIAGVDDFTTLNHRKWEKFRLKRKHRETDKNLEVEDGDDRGDNPDTG